MKKIDLGQLTAILANLGVIAGIVFLAMELRQNYDFLRSDAEYRVMQNRMIFDTEAKIVAPSKLMKQDP